MIEPYTGKLYTDLADVPLESRDRLVEVHGDREDIYQMGKAISHYNAVISPDRSKRRAANKEAKKARKRNRK